MQTQKRKELRVRNKCTCHVYGQIHQYKIQIETEEIKLDAQSSKTKLQKIQRWQRVEKQKTLKLKTQVFQLKQPHKKPGFPLTIGRIEHGTLEHPIARRAPYYPICYTCSWHSPPLLVSVATSCLNREGLEPKGYGALAPLAVCFAVFSMVRRKSGWGICVLPFVLVFRCLVSYDLSYFMRPPVSMLKFS